ncbi:NLR family CARD domain-containing protein 4 [Holothuria leucospilota]|uniref:NLR family CARD domain-containing protein 4 n=1 Tax=Holothuria leucospilota TaxID=206669 RepID=A0A9Q1CMX8_HOLLE|nr:NLR family CARD domain-containing protein 4 [Holothuria leucospilota]
MTALDFKPAERDKVERSEDHGQFFIHSLREKGIINEKDVSTLTDKLKLCGLHGVAFEVIKSFTRYLSSTRLQQSNLGNYEEKKSLFKEQLRIKYKYLCGSIQAVPFLRDKYDINELFVGSGFEFLEETRAATHEQEMWTRLKDYKMIFTDPKLDSKRRIIEGDPGYGKSTLALQITNDWCQGKAPMKDFDILILLRLRYFRKASTVYSAVKSFLLPKDTELTEDNIKNILDTSQIVVILDGYDEYPYKDREETDIEHIIRGDMFQKYEVVLLTRKSCLPLHCSIDTKRIRLTGFDKSARDMYIRNVVARGNAETSDHINRFLRDENTIPNDLCKVPLFFTMIANMAHKSETFYHLKTVTAFFRHLIVCFHSHEQIKKAKGKREKKRFHRDHSLLDKQAFEGLCQSAQQISWNAKVLRAKITNDLYDEYVRIGILVEEDVYNCEAIEYHTESRFYHKLFLEWYAAHHLAREAAKRDTEFEPWPQRKNFLQCVNPTDLHYMFRFACGLSSDAALKIIKHLGKNENHDKSTLLCITEYGGSLKNIVDTVESLCLRRIDIDIRDSLLLQNSTVELVKFASNKKFPISEVWLINCLDSSFPRTGKIHLKKIKLTLPVMTTLKKLVVWEEGLELTEETIASIFQYLKMYLSLKKLM